jgi:hypothetical protein
MDIDIQLERLTPSPRLPQSGRMNGGRRFNAEAGAHHTLRQVVTPEFNRRHATQALANTYPALMIIEK